MYCLALEIQCKWNQNWISLCFPYISYKISFTINHVWEDKSIHGFFWTEWFEECIWQYSSYDFLSYIKCQSTLLWCDSNQGKKSFNTKEKNEILYVKSLRRSWRTHTHTHREQLIHFCRHESCTTENQVSWYGYPLLIQNFQQQNCLCSQVHLPWKIKSETKDDMKALDLFIAHFVIIL